MKIGVIGSRKMSEYGKKVVDKIIKLNLDIWTIKTSGINSRLIAGGAKYIEGENFYENNKKLAEICDKLLIIEAGENSGTILVAKEFLDLGKEVWAVPGRIDDEQSKGCNYLIKNGAMMLTEIEDLVE